MNGIQKTNGQWWTGKCWGTKEAAYEFEGYKAPIFLEEEGENELVIGCIAADPRYYAMDPATCDILEGSEPVASVKPLRGRH
jgi:hypothetical protein